MFPLHVLLTEDRIAASFRECLEDGFLPEFLFYWSPLSVSSWRSLCAGGPYRVYERSLELVRRHAGELASRIDGDPTAVVSLGAGCGTKDRIVMNAIVENGGSATYVPVDSSRLLLNGAGTLVRQAGHEVHGIKGDITASSHVESVGELLGTERRRLLLALGNNLGAWGPCDFLKSVRGLLREGDLLVVDAELYAGEETMAGFDNPVNHGFAFAPLKSLDIDEGDGKLEFRASQLDPARALYAISKSFVLHREVEVSIGGKPLRLPPEHRIEMSASAKFTLDSFVEIIEGSGYRCIEIDLDSARRHALAIVEPGSMNGH